MVKTFIIDAPVLMLFGFLFSWFLKPSDYEIPLYKTKPFKKGLLFSTLFNISVIISYIQAPEWMWMYYLEDLYMPVWGVVYLFIFLYYVPYIGGFLLGAHLNKVKKNLWILGAIICILFEIAIVTLLWDRYSVVGTVQEFTKGTARSLFSGKIPVSMTLNITSVILLVYFIYLWRKFTREKKTVV